MNKTLVGLVAAAGLYAAPYALAWNDRQEHPTAPIEVDWSTTGKYALGVMAGLYVFSGFRTVRPTERGVVERFGKFNRVSTPGLTWVIPGIDHMIRVNITEMMIDPPQQEVITKDNLNAKVDAQIYFKVRPDDENVKRSLYNVNEYMHQIVALSQTTLRAIIGNLSLKEANSMRNKLNEALAKELDKQTDAWGIEVVRAELKEIRPPSDVQETMNKVVKAENEKIAAIDFAQATETKADGERRAEIKKAEGIKQAKILAAEGEAEAITCVAEAQAKAIKMVNEAAEQYFKGQAVAYKRLEVTDSVLKNNSKYIVIPPGTDLVTVVGEGHEQIVPVMKKE